MKCMCGCGKNGHHWHHALIHRMKRFSEHLDDPRNLVYVNAEEHISRTFDNQRWKKIFYLKNVERFGQDAMDEWIKSLPEKLKYRLDFLPLDIRDKLT